MVQQMLDLGELGERFSVREIVADTIAELSAEQSINTP
jgi:hypothetical protein